jgi:hypothetical protein
MDATDILYTLIELDSLGEHVIPAVKRCIAEGANLGTTTYYIPPLWEAIDSQCSLELVELLAQASYKPSDVFLFYCEIDIIRSYPRRNKVRKEEKVAVVDTVDDDCNFSCRSQLPCNITLLEFIRYNIKALRRIRKSSRGFKQYYKILKKSSGKSGLYQ